MTKNMDIWNILGETDPTHTRSFDRGNFKGTDINPQYRWMKLTEAFGPAGKGWGIETYTADAIDLPSSQEKMICIAVTGFYMSGNTKHLTPPGFGQDFIIRNTRSGLRTDDEGYKKAFTDALGNAFKYVGLGADVYMGMYDDSKYVNSLVDKYGPNIAVDKDKPAAAPANLPDIPEGRDHLAEVKDGKLILKPQEDGETGDLIEFFKWYLQTIPSLATLIEVCATPQPAIDEVEHEVSPISEGCRAWAVEKLSKVKTEKALKGAWQKIAGVVNGLKNTSPLAYEGVRAGFKQVGEELKNG